MTNDTQKTTESVQNSCALFFHEDEILMQSKNNEFIISVKDICTDEFLDSAKKETYFLEIFDKKSLYVIAISPEKINNHEFHFLPVRKILEKFDSNSPLFRLICRAKHLLHWNKVSQFCGECGGTNQLSNIETAKICQQCQRVTYPHYHPAILVLIEHKNEILLARSHHFTKGLYAPLAGFISPSETAEEAVAREVREEVDLEIKDIRYFANQSWPFPSSFMVGYFAQYASGSICIDPHEIEDARWFNVNNLPPLMPSKISISGQLIDNFLRRNL
jgi:NAD+ diphosphatase